MAKKNEAAEQTRKILGLRWVPAKDLIPNRKNWRKHPEHQKAAIREAMQRLGGYCDALLARELEDGTLELIDGHLRAETTPDEQVPVLVLDLDQQGADYLLATLDPLAALAETDGQKLHDLMTEVSIQEDSIRQMLTELAASAPIESQDTGPKVKPMSIQRPPEMTWVLIGIPTLRFGEIAEDVEHIAGLKDVQCETTVTSGG